MKKPSVRIGKGSYEGHKAVTLATRAMRMCIVTDAGPRIAFFGKPKGRNLLFWDKQGLRRGEWRLMGGHRVWPTRPGADESEDAYRPDNDKTLIGLSKRDEVTVISPADRALNVHRGITVRVVGEDRLEVENFIENHGPMLYSCGAWALTCTLPGEGTTYGIPLGDGSDWDCFNLVMFKKWAGHNSGFDDDQISFTPDLLILRPKGRETKRMLQAPRGIIAMDAPDCGCTFAKRTGYDRSAAYPLGCNMAFYVGPKNFMVEMETMGPEITLKSGERAVNRESWVLADSAAGVRDACKLIGLFGSH